ncbi:MAG: hypothetical protein PHX04_01820 [Bacilli bacterium]|nr:hypothetical protein [Bacilli bacterium]
MSYYVRKINRAKWKTSEKLNDKEDVNKLEADFLSSCLKVQHGEISLWKIKDESEINDVVIAIVSVGDYADKVDLILIDENDLNNVDITPINAPEGNTKIREQHYKLCDLNYEAIGKVAKIIFNKIETDVTKCKRISARETKSIIINAVSTGELTLLPDSKLLESCS